MERIKVSKYFFLDEFVDPFTFLKSKDNGLSKVDERLFLIADLLREKLGKPLRINNWWNYYQQNKETLEVDKIISNIEKSDLSKWSGFRSDRCKIGAPQSAHKLGKAIDPKGDEEVMFEIVKENAKEFHALGLRRLEDISITNGWLHMDVETRNVKENTIRIIDLRKETGVIKI